MAHTLSLTKLIYDPSRFKTPNVKDASSSDSKDVLPNPPILMDEYGQTPDHFYLARKPPASFLQVKRKLDLQSYTTPEENEVKPVKRRRKNDSISLKEREKANSSTRGKHITTDKPRYDTSLGHLTKKFLELLTDAVDGIVNLNTACTILSVPKRRLYDITNVLEGAGLIQKTSRNNIQYTGRVSSPSPNVVKYDLEKEIDILESKENQLDELIYHMKSEIKSLKEAEGKFHYVTSNDLRSIEEFSKKMLVGVKISPTGQLIEAFEKKVIFSSKHSEIIGALLVTEDTSFTDVLHSGVEFKENSYTVQISNNQLINSEDSTMNESCYQKFLSPYKTFASAYSRLCASTAWTEGDTVIKNAFISEEDDIAPMGKNFLLQTEDQDFESLPFSELESHVDSYLFSLDDGEGLTDLFDCQYTCP